MLPSAKSMARKGAWPTWLVLGVLGLAATAGGLFLPRSFRPQTETPTAISPTTPTNSETKESLVYTPPALPDLPSPGSMLLRLTLGTIFVLILCAITLWAGKRWIRPLAGPQGENKQLHILESLALGGRCSVYLLQAGEAKVLAGVDHAGLKALLPLPTAFAGTLAEIAETTEGENVEAGDLRAA
jgi:flagellar biogenesis protein FliO